MEKSHTYALKKKTKLKDKETDFLLMPNLKKKPGNIGIFLNNRELVKVCFITMYGFQRHEQGTIQVRLVFQNRLN